MNTATPGQVVGAILVVAAAALLAGIVWQHLRYLRRRRGPAQDRQALLHGRRAFHVVTLLKLPPGAEGLAPARSLVATLERFGRARVVYAGQRLVIGIQSQQLPPVEWDLALLSQYPSREAHAKARQSPEVQAALAAFDRSFEQGFRRSAAMNLALPILLLARRLADLLRRRPARLPFTPARSASTLEGDQATQRARLVAALRRQQELARDAVVVVNFTKRGTPEQQARNRTYTRAMLGLMAEGGHGPLHLGRAVAVDGHAAFDSVTLVYYPGAAYFADMAESDFFGPIIGNKQLGDTLAMVTAPILYRLLDSDDGPP